MSKKLKCVMWISIALNVLLILFAAWGYAKVHFAAKQIFMNEVQQHLVELEGLIAHQKENHWAEPSLVAVKLSEVADGLWLGIETGEQLSTLRHGDQNILQNLYHKLKQYPANEMYRFTEVTDEDKGHFEKLHAWLREAGFGLGIQIDDDWKGFINRAKLLEEKIPRPL